MIYTERMQPSKIKYLKVLLSGPSGKYSLFGNTQVNKLECAEDKECDMHGHYGDDEFYLKSYYKPSTVKDFRNGNGADKLFIKDLSDTNNISCFGSEKALVQGGENTPVQTCLGSGASTTIRVSQKVGSDLLYSLKTSQITLENKGVEEVGGWLKDAKNEDGKYNQKELLELPIIIQKNF